MGECLITRRGGESYELPVLNTSFPKDVSLTVVKGNSTSATFSVSIATAGKPAEYTYQWYLNGSAVSGATGSSYTKTGLTTSGTYSVYCEVANKAGIVTSRVATLKVEQYYTPVLNTNYPANASKTYITGNTASASFSVVVATAGNPTSYTYQWYVNNVAVSGATSSTYNWSGTEGSYNVYCKVTNAAGSVDSRTATLSVTRYYTPVLNSSYPANASKTYITGNTASATFEVKIATAGVPASYTYQWYLNNSAVSGATGSKYTWTGTEGTYKIYCKVTNSAGSVNSRTAALSVTKYYTPVLNTSYPQNASIVTGNNATFKVTIATAGVPASYTYQWYVNNTAVSGATSSSYTRTGNNTVGTYTVYCKVTNSAGTVQSRTATLTVTNSQPTYTYTGSSTLTKEGTSDWRIDFYSSGTLTLTGLGKGNGAAQVFVCGGGGAGGKYSGGGGGYTKTGTTTLKVNTPYTITVGAGGQFLGNNKGGGQAGGQSSAFGVTANGGGGGGVSYLGANGGSGGGTYSSVDASGASGGNGGSDGSNGFQGTDNTQAAGTGQGTTTREFGLSSGTLYAGGGGGGYRHGGGGGPGGTGGAGGGGNGAGPYQGNTGGTDYLGGGGGGGNNYDIGVYTGGIGRVVLRNTR